MLSNINISNLDNSVSKTSVYSDAFENSFQVEQQYLKNHKSEIDKSENIKDFKDIKSLNENNFINKSEEFRLLNKIFQNNDLDDNECFTQNHYNVNNKGKIPKEKMINNINNRYIINKNINCNNINKINLSNVNIIIK